MDNSTLVGTTIGMSESGDKFSLLGEIGMLGIPVKPRSEVRRIKREMCPTVFHFLFSLISRLAQTWVLLAIFLVGTAAIVPPFIFLFGSVSGLATVTSLFFVLLMYTLLWYIHREERRDRINWWLRIPYSPLDDGNWVEEAFRVPLGTRRHCKRIALALPDAKIYVERDSREDPFVCVTRGRECVYIAHWEVPRLLFTNEEHGNELLFSE